MALFAHPGSVDLSCTYGIYLIRDIHNFALSHFKVLTYLEELLLVLSKLLLPSPNFNVLRNRLSLFEYVFYNRFICGNKPEGLT